jgi:hypothetical protein
MTDNPACQTCQATAQKPHYKIKHPIVTCRFCGKTFQTTHPNQYTCTAYDCQQKRISNNRDKYRGAMEPRPCRWCGKLFMPKTRQQNRRKHCYEEECEVKQSAHWRRVSMEAARLWRKRVVKGKPCSICGKPLPKDRHYRHDHCVADLEYRMDDNYIYLPVMEA